MAACLSLPMLRPLQGTACVVIIMWGISTPISMFSTIPRENAQARWTFSTGKISILARGRQSA